ncbi:hypothetical protein [Montanilutibacter psychrotolerans]|uniref:hypothetical protein n=1 Tax=Montanilutibacter psychrotolerans TaxID=1327343 RepID=UPI0011CD9E2D|nr:hypothetical protein [Lysobacter psychrotolerans]
MKALSGELAPGIGGVVTQVQAQVSTLGWRIDDLLLTAQAAGVPRRLAVSAKGNLQVNAAGLPADFVMRAWDQWRDLQGPFSRVADGLALVTIGTDKAFVPTWREVKNACSGTDAALTLSRIRSNKRQSRVFDSVQKPGGASDEETIELIRRLHVLPTDLQLAHSENETQAVAQCRRLLASGREDEAQSLWKELINVAKEVRLRRETITVPDLLSLLRGQFGLRHHHWWRRLSSYFQPWARAISNTTILAPNGRMGSSASKRFGCVAWRVLERLRIYWMRLLNGFLHAKRPLSPSTLQPF